MGNHDIKFTINSEAITRAKVQAESNKSYYLSIEVTDTGIGIVQQTDLNIPDSDAIIVPTHILKGISCNVCPKSLSAICQQPRLQLNAGQLNDSQIQINETEKVYSQTRNEYLRVYEMVS